jgi:hypothetical protein
MVLRQMLMVAPYVMIHVLIDVSRLRLPGEKSTGTIETAPQG